MVSVGVLAALINVVVLLTVALADRAIELIVRNFAQSRLHRHHRAPVVHDSDTWLPNIPRSVLKYHKHPAILVTVLCTIFLITSELITELGVDVSEVCTPERRRGTVITEGGSKGLMTSVELGASAFLLQTIRFKANNLTRVPAGMPKKITGMECLSCFDDAEKPDIVSSCRVDRIREYRPGEITVSVRTTDGPFKTLSDSFAETGGEKHRYDGLGDLTGNGKNRAIFVFSNKSASSSKEVLQYLEYADPEHCEQLKDRAVENNGQPVFADNRANVGLWSISCDVNMLRFEHFLEAMMVYRTIQLENPVDPTRYEADKVRFAPITADDVYRAALSMKIIDDTDEEGDYFVYTSCGQYKWEFIAPLIICVSIIAILGLVSWYTCPRTRVIGIPHNSRSWYRHSRGRSSIAKENDLASSSGYFDSVFEEMFLVSDGPGGENPRVEFRSRSRSRQARQQDIINSEMDYGHEYAESFDPPFEEPFS